MVERCGNYTRQAAPGINCVCWPIDNIVGIVSMRIQQLEVRCETKTLDNVFVSVRRASRRDVETLPRPFAPIDGRGAPSASAARVEERRRAVASPRCDGRERARPHWTQD